MKFRLYLLLALLGLWHGLFDPHSAAAQGPKIGDSFKQAFSLARAGKLAEAEQPLNLLLAETNDTSIPKDEVLAFRGFLRGANGRFQDAAGDLEQVVEMDPSEQTPRFLLVPLLIQTGDIAAYQSQCREMLHLFGKTTNAPVAERTAKCCLLLPSGVSPDDLARAAKVAENAVGLGKKGEHKPWRLMTLGLAQYRQGHFARAIDTLELGQKDATQGRDAGRDMCQADMYFISAMAHHQLKQSDEARTAMAHGRLIMQVKAPALDSGNLGFAWVDVLMTYTLMAEAKATVADTTAAQPK